MLTEKEIENAIEVIKSQTSQIGRRGNHLNPNTATRLNQRRTALEHENGCGGCANASVTIAPAFTVGRGVDHVTVNCAAEFSPLTVGDEIVFNPNFKCRGYKKKA